MFISLLLLLTKKSKITCSSHTTTTTHINLLCTPHGGHFLAASGPAPKPPPHWDKKSGWLTGGFTPFIPLWTNVSRCWDWCTEWTLLTSACLVERDEENKHTWRHRGWKMIKFLFIYHWVIDLLIIMTGLHGEISTSGGHRTGSTLVVHHKHNEQTIRLNSFQRQVITKMFSGFYL